MKSAFGVWFGVLLSLGSPAFGLTAPQDCWRDSRSGISVRDATFDVRVDAQNLSVKEVGDIFNHIGSISGAKGFFSLPLVPEFENEAFSFLIVGGTFQGESRASYKERVNGAVEDVAKLPGVTVTCKPLPVPHPAGSGSNFQSGPAPH